jgi:hypothetical protein
MRMPLPAAAALIVLVTLAFACGLELGFFDGH